MSDNYNVLRLARDNARAYEPEEETPPPLDDGDPGAEETDNGNPLDETGLPKNFPIVPLGVQGTVCYFLDELGQLQHFAWKDVARANIEGMMGRQPFLLERFWPRKDDKGRVKGWRPEDAGRSLKTACAFKGVWSPADKVRGAGCWLGPEGELIVHYGSRVFVYPLDGEARDLEPGVIGELVYPSRPPLPMPATEHEPASGVGAEILADLRTWHWARGETDACLMLGHIVAGILSGALSWRPLVWTPGGKGRGKSTLHKFIALLLGRWLVSTSDATGAGIWQKLGFDSRPVNIDEAEGEEDNRRMMALLALARQAASGGVVLRGGADHEGREFTARSSFLFSSIAMPPLNSADRSRLAILELRELVAGSKQPDMKPKRLEALGRRLLRRIVAQWPRFEETLESYRATLEAAGHSARGADVFGTLLACQDLVRFDHLPDGETLSHWASALAIGDLAELAGDLSIEKACLNHLLTQRLDAFKGGVARTVGEWVMLTQQIDLANIPTPDAQQAVEVLNTYGLAVKLAPRDKKTHDYKWPGTFLWVAARHAALGRLFERTKWQGGADTQGGWVQHLSWLPCAHGNVPFWCGGQTKAVLVPIELVSRDGMEIEV